MKYPIGVQNFEKIRRDGFLYIDKTELIYKLVNESCYYFLSRPRRFGKSLLISTLEAYFQGKKELFKGLAIDTLEKEWTARPVLHIDLNARQYENADSLRQELNKHLELWETAYNSPYGDRALEERFYHVIRLAHEQTGHRVAILVDEYDKPLLQAIGNKPLQEEYRNILKPFYGVLKTMDGHIKFAMLTGVTKFGKVSVFSDLNNLKDISMLPQYASLCGLTESEIHRYMEEGIQNLAATQHLTYDETCRKLKVLYDGYHFSPGSEGIYNPFSILRTMDSGIFGSYWFETGTPTYLVTLLKQGKCDLSEISSAVTDVETLDSIYGDDEPIPVIYQSGYLTIKGYNPRFESYTLGFPNKEVEEGFDTPPELHGRHALRTYKRPGTPLPERHVHRIQAPRLLRAGRVPHLTGAHRSPAPDRQVRLHHGVQVRGLSRGCSEADRGLQLRRPLRLRLPQSPEDRHQLLNPEQKY